MGEVGGLAVYAFLLNGTDAVDCLGLKDCKVIIWVGHDDDVKRELAKFMPKEKREVIDECTRHAVFSCEMSKWKEWDDKTLDRKLLIPNHPEIWIKLGAGAMVVAQRWTMRKGDPGEDVVEGYLQGMSIWDYQESLYQLIEERAQAEARRMAADTALIKRCCCKQVTVELRYVKNGRKKISERVRVLADKLKDKPVVIPIQVPASTRP